MVELEEIIPYGIYYRKGKPLQLLDEHFQGNTLELAKELTGIDIDPIHLKNFGFDCRLTTGICSKEWKDCKIVLLPTKLGWKIQFPGIENAGYIQHLHHVQRLWFSHFQEHLWLPKVKKETAPAPVILEAEIQTEKYINKNRTYSKWWAVQPEDQEYYITWDSRFLLRPRDGVIWRVNDKSPLFSHAGRNWGLTLDHGIASEVDRVNAAKWLKKLLQKS